MDPSTQTELYYIWAPVIERSMGKWGRPVIAELLFKAFDWRKGIATKGSAKKASVFLLDIFTMFK